MTEPSLFGLNRERKIVKSNVRNIFTPHQPIDSLDLFFGRQKEVQKIIEYINTPGQHALLYGDRGVGKSSLANVASRILISNIISGKLYKKRCDTEDTFETLIHAPLKDSGYDQYEFGFTETHEESGEAGVGLPLFKAGVQSTKSTSTSFGKQKLTPSVAAEILQSNEGLLLIDEADALNNDDKFRLSQLIKFLSDGCSKFKIFVVGIAKVADDLTASHPSVRRCLKETKLRRMSDEELWSIVEDGAKKINNKKLGLVFLPEVIHSIVSVSSGYPHFTHLLALKCAEEAITFDKSHITTDILNTALNVAVDDAESTLRRQYDNAIRSHSTAMYKKILCASSKINKDEFSAKELREALNKMTGEDHNQSALNNFLKKLVSNDETTILTRKSKGIYQFTDPRMPSFIKIANSSD